MEDNTRQIFFYVNRCSTCRFAIQTSEYTYSTNVVNGREVLAIEALESEESAKHCRGQGKLYSTSRLSSIGVMPSYENHFTFSGTFSGSCCYCARLTGLHVMSFRDIGCYHCKQREFTAFAIKEFAKLKGRRPDSDRSRFWYDLEVDTVDYIFGYLLGEER